MWERGNERKEESRRACGDGKENRDERTTLFCFDMLILSSYQDGQKEMVGLRTDP